MSVVRRCQHGCQDASQLASCAKEVLVQILVRVPFADNAAVRSTCTRWDKLVCSPAFQQQREDSGFAEDLLVVAGGYEGGGYVMPDVAGFMTAGRSQGAAAFVLPPLPDYLMISREYSWYEDELERIAEDAQIEREYSTRKLAEHESFYEEHREQFERKIECATLTETHIRVHLSVLAENREKPSDYEAERAKRLPSGVYSGCAVGFNGKMYLFGGLSGGDPGYGMRNVRSFCPRTGCWNSEAPLPEPRSGAAGGGFPGFAIVAGGENTGEFSPQATRMSLMALVGYQAGCDLKLPGPAVYGHDWDLERAGPHSDAWRFDFSADEWVAVADMPYPVYDAASIVFAGKLFVVGGKGFDHEPLTGILVYDPKADTWEDLGPPAGARAGDVQCSSEGAALGGKLYISGSHPHVIDYNLPLADRPPRTTGSHPIDIYDPEEHRWSACPALPSFEGYGAPLLGVLDGHLLALGQSEEDKAQGNVSHAFVLFGDEWRQGPVAPRGTMTHATRATVLI
jgi:hypothetical protein